MKNIDKVENSFGFGCSRDLLWSPVERGHVKYVTSRLDGLGDCGTGQDWSIMEAAESSRVIV